jgi:hypothetical protein
MIAFLRAVDPDRALANVVVVKRDGTSVANILFRPAEADVVGGMRFVESLQWLTDSKIAASGSINPTTTETVVIDLQDGSEIADVYDDAGGAIYSARGDHVAYYSGSPHFTPMAFRELALNVDYQRVFPVNGHHVSFGTDTRWSPNGSQLAVVFEDDLSKEHTLVTWSASAGVSATPLGASAGEDRHIFWIGDSLYLTSNGNTVKYQVQVGKVTAQKTSLVSDPLISADRFRKALRATAVPGGGRDADFWCVGCGLSELPRMRSVGDDDP